jgi:CheY-like chemotaxis protein
MTSSAPTKTDQIRVLVVEDEFIIAMDIAMQLRELGYEPIGHASRGEQAINMTKQLKPDLVLMDVHLSGSMDGITAAASIRAQVGTRIVFLSAFDSSANRARAEAVGAVGYITKPFDTDELRAVIDGILH